MRFHQLFLGGVAAAVVSLAITRSAAAETIAIENAVIHLEANTETGAITMRHRYADVTFVDGVHWPTQEKLASVTREERQSTEWGAGQSVKFQWDSGSMASITLYDRLPFAVVQHVLVNKQDAPLEMKNREIAVFDVSLGKPLDECSAFGTFGLNKLTDSGRRVNNGSYNHLAIVNPANRAGVVTAWLTSERGTGVFFYKTGDGDKVGVTARQDYGHLLVKPHENQDSEMLLIGYFGDARIGLESYADAVRDHYQIKLRPQPSVYCTWYHAGASDEKHMQQQTEYAEKNLKPYGFSVLQIDDKWQDGISKDGPKRIFTRVRPDGPYPHGMKATADMIKSHGLVPGLWYMPFAGTSYDPYFADKQDIFATKDGKPFEVKWGGTCLDLTTKKALDLVYERTSTICNDWGFQYIKIDGLWTGMASAISYVNEGYKEDNFGEAKLANPNMTHVEAYREGMKTVRTAAGPNVFILGCNLAQNMRILGPSMGYFDAMRIGPDNKQEWNAMVRGPFSGSNLYFLHGRVWYNDPDPVYVRPSVPLEHAKALLSWVTLSGQLHANSYYYADLPPERFDLLKRAIPSHNLLPRPVDLFDERTPRIWLLTDDHWGSSPFYVVGLFNWKDKDAAEISATFEKIGLPRADKYVTFDYWGNKFGTLGGSELREKLPGATCKILAVRPVSDHPQIISTSRHITQGVIDVMSENWDAGARTLTGSSNVVGNDPYELRIAKPASGDWKLKSPKAELMISQAEAGPPASGTDVPIKLVSEDENGWRVRIDVPENRLVQWTLQF